MEKFRFIKNKNFLELPKTTGVYCFCDKKEILYIGKAINIQSRVKNHFQQPSYRDNLFIDKVNKIGFLDTNSEIEALLTEANLIKKYQPKFNVVWKDDKNYFYIAITKTNNPQIYITHQPNKQLTTNRLTANKINKNHKLEVRSYNLDVDYLGPFIEGIALKKTIRFLRKVFPYYTVAKHSDKKCTYCHLGLCPGPNPDIKEYHKNIKKLKKILEGKSKTVLTTLKKEMSVLSKNKKFEEAASIRDKINSLEKVMMHSGIISTSTNLNTWEKTSNILKGLIGLEKLSRIECYDISNIQGVYATGSMVVFINGIPDKSLYKKFKIKMENTPNDTAMLKEIISRRLEHKEWDYPEIMLIDGGIAQLNSAIEIKSKKAKSIKIISIAKRNKDLYIEGRKDFIPLKNLPQEVYNLIIRLDDEAHRFAISYHKKLRKKGILK